MIQCKKGVAFRDTLSFLRKSQVSDIVLFEETLNYDSAVLVIWLHGL